MFVIEVDGITHNDKMDYDFKRQNDLERFSLKVLRFNALDVVQNTQSVLDEIYCWINENRKPTPNLAPASRRVRPSQDGEKRDNSN